MKGVISITRPNGGGFSDSDKTFFQIIVKDCLSNARFLSIKIEASDLIKAISGEAEKPIDFDVEKLDLVGKKRESKPLIIEMPGTSLPDKCVAEKLAIESADEGWTPDLYFGAQSSFFKKDGKYYALTRQFRFVSVDSDE